MRSAISAASMAVIAVLSAALIYATWILPYRFPPRKFVVGASYEMGFNNSISFLGYLIGVGALAFVIGRLLPRTQELPASTSPRRRGIADVVAAVVIVGHIVLFALVYAYKGRFIFAESLYFQQLLYRMASGDLPYTDFGFYYGPSMLYPAYWLSRVVGLDLGYGIWFITTYTVGLVFLYGVLRVCLPDDRSRAFWFVLLALGLFNPLTGLNETFTRYLLPSVVFLAFVAFITKGTWTFGVLTSLLGAFAMTYSFEAAALSIGGTGLITLMLLVVFQADRMTLLMRSVAALVVAMVLAVIFFLAVDPSGRALADYSSIAASYSSGAHAIPIYPHLPFIALSLVTIGSLAAAYRLVADGSERFIAACVVAYSAMALLAQRAAFGAAEPSHFAYFGLPMVCLALYLTNRAAAHSHPRRWLGAVLAVGIMMPMQYYHVTQFVPFFTARLQAAETPVHAAAPDAPSTPRAAVEQDLRDIVQHLGTRQPYVMLGLEYSSLPVYRDFGLRYATYSTQLITARDEEGMQRAIDEVRRTGAIVIVRKADLAGVVPQQESRGVARVLDLLSGAHTAGSRVNAVLVRSFSRLTEPLLKFVQTDYEPLYEHNDLVAYGPRRETGAK